MPPYRGLVLGQVLSLCLTAGCAFHGVLEGKYGLSLEALEMAVLYSVLSLLFWLYLCYKRDKSLGDLCKGFKSLDLVLISILDFSASVLALKAYMYISLPKVTLLSTISTPTVMCLSWAISDARYSWRKCGGALLAVLGVVGIGLFDLYEEYKTSQIQESGSAYLGYVFSISSAILYGICNVLSERFLKGGTSLAEYLALSSSFSSVLSLFYLYYRVYHVLVD